MGGADRDIDSDRDCDADAECAIPGLATLLHSARRNGLAGEGKYLLNPDDQFGGAGSAVGISRPDADEMLSDGEVRCRELKFLLR
jgi:hypothetical protein